MECFSIMIFSELVFEGRVSGDQTNVSNVASMQQEEKNPKHVKTNKIKHTRKQKEASEGTTIRWVVRSVFIRMSFLFYIIYKFIWRKNSWLFFRY